MYHYMLKNYNHKNKIALSDIYQWVSTPLFFAFLGQQISYFFKFQILCLTLLGALTLYADKSHGFTIEDAFRSALQSNPTIGEAVEQRRSAEYGLQQAHGRFLPSVDVSTRAG
ncbi:MAG: hypothetical protein AAF403_01355, partial [Pseudomonadota bacterium]